MKDLESDLHLYQPPLYCGKEGHWYKSYADAVNGLDADFNYDPAAILSLISFGYSCGDRTLLKEIRCRPWLSKVADGTVHLNEIPPHGRIWQTHSKIAENLKKLLLREAIKACEGREHIYLLLSGGLDSRIVAGILGILYQEGQLINKPITITWGLKNSRDVVYARAVAEICGLHWEHVSIGPENIIANIELCAASLAGLVPPSHLHHMMWFKNVSKDAIVLNGSYGDSVGRAEFSGRHVLELDYLRPANYFNILKKGCYLAANEGLQADLKALHERSADQPKYVYCEHEMQGHYMRGMIGHSMSIINHWCSLYHMFTDPEVYSYMWSIHPTQRDDNVYAELLEKINPQLSRLPWARTNRALRGKTKGSQDGLLVDYHEYSRWVSGPLYEELKSIVDPDWFAETGIFNPGSISDLTHALRTRHRELRKYGFRPYELWLWLAVFRRFAEGIEKLDKKVLPLRIQIESQRASTEIPSDIYSGLRRTLARSKLLHKSVQRVRRVYLKRQAYRRYPPSKGPTN